MSDAPVGAQTVPEGTPVPVVEVPTPAEFDRPGQPSVEDYIAGLKREFALADDGAKKAIKAELDRVSKFINSTADAVKEDLEKA